MNFSLLSSHINRLEDDTAGMVWAPSALYDAASQQYYVFWSSRFYSTSDPSHQGTAGPDIIRYCTTRDFTTFSAPADYISIPGTSVIDQEFQALPTANSFSRFIKNETIGKVYQEVTSEGLFGTWTRVGGDEGYVVQDTREGPASFRDNLDENTYHLWLDNYAGNGNYVPYQTSNIEQGGYTQSDAPNFPQGLRHGSVTPVTQAQYNALQAKI